MPIISGPAKRGCRSKPQCRHAFWTSPSINRSLRVELPRRRCPSVNPSGCPSHHSFQSQSMSSSTEQNWFIIYKPHFASPRSWSLHFRVSLKGKQILLRCLPVFFGHGAISLRQLLTKLLPPPQSQCFLHDLTSRLLSLLSLTPHFFSFPYTNHNSIEMEYEIHWFITTIKNLVAELEKSRS